ncbi:hypothetical protein ILYODFUR_029758, partial [Ilyodon furcidens]
CNIVSVTSPSASTLNVIWSSYDGSSFYVLDLRVVNSTDIAPVMLTVSSTQRLVQGLRAGQVYQLTLSAYGMLYVPLCTVIKMTMTVPAASQITSSQAISSTSIKFNWSNVTGVESYILFVEERFSSPLRIYNRTFNSSCGQMDGLTPSTTYDCYIYSSNSAGRGAKSNTKTTITLVQPPTNVTLTATGKSTARVTWNPVSKVLLYQVTVRDIGRPNKPPVVRNSQSTSMDIGYLEPCSFYIVGVSSVNIFLVPGEPSTVAYNTTRFLLFGVGGYLAYQVIPKTWAAVQSITKLPAMLDGVCRAINTQTEMLREQNRKLDTILEQNRSLAAVGLSS